MTFASSNLVSYIPLATAIGCLLVVILIRIALEGYVVLYRAAQDLSSLSRSKNVDKT